MALERSTSTWHLGPKVLMAQAETGLQPLPQCDDPGRWPTTARQAGKRGLNAHGKIDGRKPATLVGKAGCFGTAGGMMTGQAQTAIEYKVVLNHEEQYSIWPAARQNPQGWRDEGKRGTEAECLAHIDEVWSDMRPLSLRVSMAESETAIDGGSAR